MTKQEEYLMVESSNPIGNPGASDNDPLDISELAALNEDYSADFLEQLQNQLSEAAGLNTKKNISMETNDAELFDDTAESGAGAETKESPEPEKKSPSEINSDIDDNFIRKYKARLQKQQNANFEKDDSSENQPKQTEPAENKNDETVAEAEVPVENANPESEPSGNIAEITGGNITEKPFSKAQADYNASLDYLDNNTKYSKYVIYIDPENRDFINSLTVKERKNLINRIIREQDSVVVTKKNLSKMQMVITHLIVAILTISLAIPCIYWVVNFSLESTINNYKTSQKMFQTLYKEKGKIQQRR